MFLRLEVFQNSEWDDEHLSLHPILHPRPHDEEGDDNGDHKPNGILPGVLTALGVVHGGTGESGGCGDVGGGHWCCHVQCCIGLDCWLAHARHSGGAWGLH